MSAAAAEGHQMTNSHVLVPEFDYVEPGSLAEAVSVLKDRGNQARVLAGGTDLLVQMKLEQLAPECLVNVSKLPNMKALSFHNGRLEIGALTAIRAVRSARALQSGYAALVEACAAFGSTQVQFMGTIGGNLCNGSPASDTVPALMALDAELVLVGPDGERVVPIGEFLLGPGKTALERGELLVSVRLRRPQPGTGSAFLKISRVAADLAQASAAAVLVRKKDRIALCRLALGSVGPTVLRARRTEAELIGKTLSSELALEAGRAASEEIAPIDDVRSSARYRREVVKALTHDVLHVAWERAAREGLGARGQGLGGKEPRGQEEVRNTHHATCSPKFAIRDSQFEIELIVNSVQHQLSVRPNELLLNVLRERLGLTGPKYGCGIGECGACTVLLNGSPALSCLVLAISADGSEVVTVEGLRRPDGGLDQLQEAFIEHNAFQCGYCTPGMLMMSKNLLSQNPSPTEGQIRDHLKGNRCRCTGFASIVRAVMSCAGGQAGDENSDRPA